MNKWVFGAISLVCIIILWCFQNSITVNIPWWDDFHGIILPVHDLFTNKSLADKFNNFVSLNNEHRVVNDRIFTLIVYIFSGKFELKALALLGFINLIGIFLVLFKVLRKENVSYLSIVPVVFLIFHAQYYESLQSLMVPFQNFSVILYMLLSLYFLIYKKSFTWGFVFAVLAIFSHGNGILTFIIGALVLLLNQKYRQAALWTFISSVTLLIYFWGYTKPEWANKATVSPLENPIAAIRYGFEFLGAYSLNLVDISTGLQNSSLKQLLPQLLGFVSIVVLLYLVLKKYPLSSLKASLIKLKENKSDQFFLGLLAFFIATGILMGLTRTGFPVLSRYTINSSFFLIGIWAFYVTNNPTKLSKAMSALTLFGLLLSYFNASKPAQAFKDNMITDAINYQINGTWANGYSDSSHVWRVNPLLIGPLKSGKYSFPKTELSEYKSWTAKSSKEALDYSIVDNYLIISGNKPDETNKVYFSLESPQYQFIFPAQQVRNNPKGFLLNRAYYSNFYQTFFPTQVIPNGNYRIYKIEKVGNSYQKFDLKRTLTESKFIL